MPKSLMIRVGRKRIIVIPKQIASELGIEEGDKLLLIVDDNKIILKPIPNAITLSLRGKKIARIYLKELEEKSINEQKKYILEA